MSATLRTTRRANAQVTPPASTPESRPTRDELLAILLREGEATAGDLAGRLAISVQATRRHLRSLEEDGLVEASPNSEGPGRPSNRWRLSNKGQAQFPNGSETFALGLLASMAGQLPNETFQTLLEQQALQKAAEYRVRLGSGSLASRLAELVELRRAEGYVAECSAEDGGWVIREYHCSVMRIAEEFPCVCDQELQLIRHTFPDCSVERVHWRLESGHSCGFRLTPQA
ncbi:MAG: iron-sulfur cluster biosynthesis transcriptional regulator SufR [Cyanobacteria bacterium M_surface_9_m1_291]|nr:iron-sulfur cluster biosynthesis transcriptional regulator SufR [Cyanobacteria bacterium M_surface_9_m1_291]